MPGRLVLWYAFLGGPLAWTAHLLASYPLVPHACRSGSVAALNLVTLLAVLLSLGAAAAGWQALRSLGRVEAGRAVGVAPKRARFMGVTGLWLALLFAFVIAVEGLPPLLQDPCTGMR